MSTDQRPLGTNLVDSLMGGFIENCIKNRRVDNKYLFRMDLSTASDRALQAKEAEVIIVQEIVTQLVIFCSAVRV